MPSTQTDQHAQVATSSQVSSMVAWVGLALGPMLFGLCLWLLPESYRAESSGEAVPFTWAGRAALAMMVWLGIWWLTEATEITVTALLPIVMFPICGIATIQQTCAAYADPLVFLYLAGFILALAMQRWGLGRRIALWTLAAVGTSARSMVAGVMIVTATISAFVSNTATTAMMLPIGLSIIHLVRRQLLYPDGDDQAVQSVANRDEVTSKQIAVDGFATCLLLSIAYSSSIGGMMTIIGTPPNAFLVGFLETRIAPPYQQSLTFLSWLPIGVPLVLCMLPVTYGLLAILLFPIGKIRLVGGRELIKNELRGMGAIRRGEWNVALIFASVVLCWLIRPLLNAWTWEWNGEVVQPFAALTDTGIAMTGAFILFLVPVHLRQREFTMHWKEAEKLPWGILLLFGGGLSLAEAVSRNGVAEFIGSNVGALNGVPQWSIVLAVTLLVIFLTELTSNAATTASLVPVLAAIAPGLDIHPYLLIFPATLAASCAFMLPVATPPNAIVFGSGGISVSQMAYAGFWLNILGTILIVLLTLLIIKPWFGI